MTAAQGDGGGVTEAEVEAGACAITRMCGYDDPYELVMHPASKSWDHPSMPRWQEWEEYSRAALEGAAARPASAGDAEEVVAPSDLESSEWGRNLFRSVIGESYKPHVWGQHRALHHTSFRFALDMADRSMPEVADVLRALICQQVITDNRARRAFDRAAAAETALAEARAENRVLADAVVGLQEDRAAACAWADKAEADRDLARAENDRLRQGKDRFKAGVRAAVTWLHARARTMNDPNAKAVLNCAGDHLGKAMARHGDHPAEAVAADALATAWNVAARHEAEAVRLRAVLRQVEWAATSRHAGFAPAPACPCCGGIIGPEGSFTGVIGHTPDCALAAALATATAEGGD